MPRNTRDNKQVVFLQEVIQGLRPIVKYGMQYWQQLLQQPPAGKQTAAAAAGATAAMRAAMQDPDAALQHGCEEIGQLRLACPGMFAFAMTELWRCEQQLAIAHQLPQDAQPAVVERCHQLLNYVSSLAALILLLGPVQTLASIETMDVDMPSRDAARTADHTTTDALTERLRALRIRRQWQSHGVLLQHAAAQEKTSEFYSELQDRLVACMRSMDALAAPRTATAAATATTNTAAAATAAATAVAIAAAAPSSSPRLPIDSVCGDLVPSLLGGLPVSAPGHVLRLHSLAALCWLRSAQHVPSGTSLHGMAAFLRNICWPVVLCGLLTQDDEGEALLSEEVRVMMRKLLLRLLHQEYLPQLLQVQPGFGQPAVVMVMHLLGIAQQQAGEAIQDPATRHRFCAQLASAAQAAPAPLAPTGATAADAAAADSSIGSLTTAASAGCDDDGGDDDFLDLEDLLRRMNGEA